MDISLDLKNPDMDAEALYDLSRQLCRKLQQEADVKASLKEIPGVPGTRGEPVSVGSIILTFLGSGTAVALFNVFRAHFERNSNLEISLQRKDGEKVSLKAHNLKRDQIDKTISLLEEFMGEKKS